MSLFIAICGLCNAPATFQRLMQRVLEDMNRQDCFVYSDNILIVSKTLEEHIEHICCVLERLKRAGLCLKPKKCSFLREEVQFLGHVISKRGILPDLTKTETVRIILLSPMPRVYVSSWGYCLTTDDLYQTLHKLLLL